jgi:hypothetical protein
MSTFRCYNVALAQAIDWATKRRVGMYVINSNGYYGVVPGYGDYHPKALAYVDVTGRVFEMSK